MNIFTNFCFTKFKQNILQNAPNCTFLKKFSGEHATEPPLLYVTIHSVNDYNYIYQG